MGGPQSLEKVRRLKNPEPQKIRRQIDAVIREVNHAQRKKEGTQGLLDEKRLGKNQALAMAHSRGRCAKLAGESKSANPYQESQIWFEWWLLGWESARSA